MAKTKKSKKLSLRKKSFKKNTKGGSNQITEQQLNMPFISNDNIRPIEEIGSGQFGKVYSGLRVISTIDDIVLKELKINNNPTSDQQKSENQTSNWVEMVWNISRPIARQLQSTVAIKWLGGKLEKTYTEYCIYSN